MHENYPGIVYSQHAAVKISEFFFSDYIDIYIYSSPNVKKKLSKRRRRLATFIHLHVSKEWYGFIDLN